MLQRNNCEICNRIGKFQFSKNGLYIKKNFNLLLCENCEFLWVQNPITDLKNIYDKNYYEGKGADPLIDYTFQLDHPEKTIRKYEWQGIVSIAKLLLHTLEGKTWLDFGCGNGGLVRYVKNTENCNIMGLEEGWIADQAIKLSIPIIKNLDQIEDNSLDFITAIEVIEHIWEPVELLNKLKKKLKPKGKIFFTTGNLAPFLSHMQNWPYIVPEVHVSFYTPKSFEKLFDKASLTTHYLKKMPKGFSDLYKFRILKTLKLNKDNPIYNVLPFSLISMIVDKKYQLSKHPLGIKNDHL